MLNFFNKTLCSLFAAGFVFSGGNYLNKYEDEVSPSANLVVQTCVPQTQTSYDPTIELPMDIGKSNLYLIKNNLLNKNTSSDYQNFLLPKSNYLFGGERIEKKYQLGEQFLEYIGLKDLKILSGKLNIYKTPFFNAGIRVKLLKIDDLVNFSFENKNFLDSLDFSINFNF